MKTFTILLAFILISFNLNAQNQFVKFDGFNDLEYTSSTFTLETSMNNDSTYDDGYYLELIIESGTYTYLSDIDTIAKIERFDHKTFVDLSTILIGNLSTYTLEEYIENSGLNKLNAHFNSYYIDNKKLEKLSLGQSNNFIITIENSCFDIIYNKDKELLEKENLIGVLLGQNANLNQEIQDSIESIYNLNNIIDSLKTIPPDTVEITDTLIIFHTETGIKEEHHLKNIVDIELTPNGIVIDNPSIAQYFIYNINGKLILNGNYDNGLIKFNTSILSNGIYLLYIKFNDKYILYKFIK